MSGAATRLDRSPDRAAIGDGVRAILPMAVAVVPFGLALGATIDASPLDPVPTLAASVLVFAGASQLSAVDLTAQGAAPLVVVVTGLLINLRFFAYSAATSRWFTTTSGWRRIALAYPLVDQLYLAMATDERWPDRSERARRRFCLGAAGLLVPTWALSQLAGCALGGALPLGGALEAAAPITLAGLLAKTLDASSARRAAAIAAVVVVMAAPGLGAACVVVAIVVATAATSGEDAP